MCGFGGIISSNKRVSRNKLSEVAQQVSFRGPDHTGINLYDSNFNVKQDEGEIGLFFNRLAIIDLDKRSNQPFENERYVLVFNGEIYNYKEIRSLLLQKGVSFLTSSDTEVLFNALVIYGSDVISKLNGMFAFVFFDKKQRKVIMSRDRAGIKPLNYLLDSSGFIFASETDSIIRLATQKPTISEEAVKLYLSLQYVPTPTTIWQNVYKLAPGSFIEEYLDDLTEKQQLTSKSYWNAYSHLVPTTDKDKNLEELLRSSLELQLQSDVPLGLFLSSGVDSSLIAALINKYFGKENKFDFFTVAFDKLAEVETDEYEDAKKFLNGFHNKNFTHHPLYVNPVLVRNELESMYTYLDEPFGDYAVMLNYVISKKAKEYVTVALSGDGSDELFWGYPRYNQWRKEHNRHWRNVSSMKGLMNLLYSGLPGKSRSRLITTDPIQLYLNQVASNYFWPDASFRNNGYWWSHEIGAIKSRKDLPSLIDLKTYLPDCMFYKVDRSSMGASLEVRVPFVDNDVIEYALKMPLQKKSTDKYPTKSLLKELLSYLAPHYSFHLPKKGFSLPLKDWINNNWKELIFSENVKQHLKTFDLHNDYASLLKIHYEKGNDCSIELWRLLNFALWRETKKNIL